MGDIERDGGDSDARFTPEPGSPPPVPTPQGQSRSKLSKRLGLTAAVIVALVGVVSLVLPAVLDARQKDSSLATLDVRGAEMTTAVQSAETVELTAEPELEPDPYADALTVGEVVPPSWMTGPLDYRQIDWRIPASASLRDFPLEGEPIEGGFIVCSTEQLAWLDANAIRDDAYSPFLNITIHNTADSGTSMALENLRFDGTEVFDEATVMFQCPDLGRGDGIRQVIMLETSGNAAVWGESYGVESNPMPEGAPVTINLAPGEVTPLTFDRAESVDRQKRYEGRILADVPGGETVILANGVTFRRDPTPGYFIRLVPNVSTGLLEFQCAVPDEQAEWGQSAVVPCTIDEVMDILGAVQQSEVTRR